MLLGFLASEFYRLDWSEGSRKSEKIMADVGLAASVTEARRPKTEGASRRSGTAEKLRGEIEIG